MRESTFILLCNSLLIHPDIALENEEIRQALRDRQSTDQIKTFLNFNFEFGNGNQEDLKSFKAKLNKTIDKEDYTTILDMSGEEEFRLLVLKGKADNINAILMITSDEDDASYILVTN